MLHGLPRYTSARLQQVSFDILTFDAVIRKSMFSFVKQCCESTNQWIQALLTSDVFYCSKYFRAYCKVTYMLGTFHDIVKSNLLYNLS